MANTITKKELASKVCDKLDIVMSHSDVQSVIQKTIETIMESLGNGDTVVFRNFGTFEVKEMKAKIGRNPKDPGKDVPIPARTIVKFKVGKTLKNLVLKVGDK